MYSNAKVSLKVDLFSTVRKGWSGNVDLKRNIEINLFVLYVLVF